MDHLKSWSKKWTLVILIVSCGIFVVLCTVIVFNKQSFSFSMAIDMKRGIWFNVSTNKPNMQQREPTPQDYKSRPLTPYTPTNDEMIFLEKYLSNRTKNVTIKGITVHYGKNNYIPTPPKGHAWPEERFIYDPLISSLAETVFPKYSDVQLVGPGDVKLGEKIKLRIELYDGKRRKRKGGDLVRAWMREPSLQAASVAMVTDNQDGSYDVTFDTFWSGKPLIRLAVISPREVIATQFRRRYIYPSTLINMGDFVDNRGGKESTPCGPLPHITGYSQICNLTQKNYGLPWYCGKPKQRSCNEWSHVSELPLWDTGYDKKLLSPIEVQLFSSLMKKGLMELGHYAQLFFGEPLTFVYFRNYLAMIIPHSITVTVKPDVNQTKIDHADRKCNAPDRTHTWIIRPPTGYLYNKKWTSLTCRGMDENHDLGPCLKNTKIVLIGDSTIRQIYESIVRIRCTKGTEKITNQNKHTTFKCENSSSGYSVEYHNHHQPFIAINTPLHFFKSFDAYFEPFLRVKESRVVVVIHIFSHFISHHSCVFYNALKPMKRAIMKLLDANPNAYVVIKGAHSYAFELKTPHKFPQKPEVYMEYYNDYLYNEFHDVHDRVIFLDAADITVASEQNFIHPEEFVVRQLIKQIFDFVCPY